MKRISLATIFACLMLALAAQDAIKVNYKGAKPTISDFAWAFFSSFDDEEEECGLEAINAFKQAFIEHRQGIQQENETFIVDEKNGYILYEWRYETIIGRMEMCYWNEADGKHKLFAYNNLASFDENGPLVTETSGLTFFRYNNATKKMTQCAPQGFEVDYDSSYALPRTGKSIIVTKWNKNGTKTEKALKWNGRRFSF